MSGEVIIRKNNETIDYNLIKKWFYLTIIIDQERLTIKC